MSDKSVADQRRVERTQEKGEGRERRAELLLDKQAKEKARQDQLEGRQAQIEQRLIEIERQLVALDSFGVRLSALEQALARQSAAPAPIPTQP